MTTQDEFEIIDQGQGQETSFTYDGFKTFCQKNTKCIGLFASIIFVDLIILSPFSLFYSNHLNYLLKFIFGNDAFYDGEIIIAIYLLSIVIRIILLITFIILKIKKRVNKKCFITLLISWSIPLISVLLFFGWCFLEFNSRGF